jgi:HEAT repeat protein
LDTSRSDFLEVAAGALKSRDSIRQLEALNGLNLVEPSGDRDAMARAIEEVLLDPDAIVRARALYALQKWATPESYDAVVPMLTDADGGVRAAALGCIRWLKDPRYAADVAPHLADPGDRSYAADALIDMGSEAEEAALSMADHPDADVLAQVCRVLGQIGTRKSEPILERLNRQTGSVGVAAGAALAAIRERERSNGG